MNAKNCFLELLLKAHDGHITSHEIHLLNEILKNNEEAVSLYAEFFDTVSGLVDLSEISFSFENDDSIGLDTWINFLAQDEKSAPAIEIPEEEPQNVLIEKVIYPKSSRSISKLSVYSALCSIAALLFMLLFIRFAPFKQEVATLTSSMNASWGDIKNSIQDGTRLLNGKKPLFLRKGLVELLFDSNARVVIEGPAEFQIIGENSMGLRYGKLFATVPQEAIGFTVDAPSAQIIDQGTEFGIEADNRGNTYLHMIKGKTTVNTGEKSNRVSRNVSKGEAKKIVNGSITDIPCKESLFVHAFDTEHKAVWRQQPLLDLVDIAAKGNGLGTGQSSVIIHPEKGYTKDRNYPFIKPQRFLPIKENRFLDGIFVPNGSPDQIISTRGDVFRDAPETSGLFSIDLVANPIPDFYTAGIRKGTVEFEGQIYGSSGKSCITMHANVGLTFDLKAIRQNYQRSITQFAARIGIFDTDEPCPCNADFWVLVDGEIRYSLRQYKQKGVLNDISVALKDTDRFLTLVTTDGGDPDNPQGGFYERSNSCDWCVFTEPVLILE